ncbi:MAG: SPFH domain-containing protein [Anaerolineae bacterium]|nr:SPFH domain-containing protein [Anaerolineae bacterium]
MVRILDIVEHPNVGRDELAWREPQGGSGDFRLGSQCIVRENQAAVFVRDGQALDVLPAGRHTLSTGNIPLLVNALGVLFSGNSPFKAEVYYINLKEFPQVGWGTPAPIPVKTPGQGLGWVLLQGHGVMAFRVIDGQAFANKYAIGQARLMLDELKERLLSMVLSALQETIGQVDPGDVMRVSSMYGQLEGAVRAKSADEFAAVGLQLMDFQIKTLSPRPAAAEELRGMGLLDIATYERLQAADAARDLASNPSGSGGATEGAMGMMAMQMMMQQMQQKQQQQPQQPQPQQPAVPANPQTREEIQAVIDSLDMRLANGEISEAVYTRLVEKWEKKLQELGG